MWVPPTQPRARRARLRSRERARRLRSRENAGNHDFNRGFHSSGTKHSEGLKLKNMPVWSTPPLSDSRSPNAPRRTHLAPWEQVSWEHSAMDLRNYRKREARQSGWDCAFQNVCSKDNPQLPRGGRSYFREPLELAHDGRTMPPLPSDVWRAHNRGRPGDHLHADDAFERPSSASSRTPSSRPLSQRSRRLSGTPSPRLSSGNNSPMSKSPTSRSPVQPEEWQY
ncbi:hypothetical protein M885DRAFT_529856 [Pelagophyceae sp. CCMP2097]|nr:hypothetical protein M885DRAFT_529856 [Pelagophyceae sp. CCMP2097]